MGIVIDMNVIACVFDEDSADHGSFQPVRERILGGRLTMVYGGTSYMAELRTASRYQLLVGELNKARKAVQVRQDAVDQRQRELEQAILEPDFGDHHIVALLCVSGSPVLCTKDQALIRVAKARGHYQDGKRRYVYGKACKSHIRLLDLAAKAKVRDAVDS